MRISPEELKERIARSPYHRWAGTSLVEVEEGRVVMEQRLDEHHLNPQGIVHGGVIAGLLDSVCGISLRTVLPADHTHRTIQLTITYLRPGRAGTVIRAVGRVIHEGRRIGHSEGEVLGADGRLMARGTASFVNLPVDQR